MHKKHHQKPTAEEAILGCFNKRICLPPDIKRQLLSPPPQSPVSPHAVFLPCEKTEVVLRLHDQRLLLRASAAANHNDAVFACLAAEEAPFCYSIYEDASMSHLVSKCAAQDKEYFCAETNQKIPKFFIEEVA